MTGWLDPVRAALDRRHSPVSLFIRDDDGGWNNEDLFRLLDITNRHGVPIDLALIPDAVDAALARQLWHRIASGEPVAVHQHGRTHANHEPTGRKSEFGPSRSIAEQWDDIEAGRRCLIDWLGDSVDPIFTPPWNRCTALTAACLAALGFQMLSRDRTAEAFGVEGICELPIHLDWTGRRGVAAGIDAWGAAIGTRLCSAHEPVGLMLHHAVMTVDDRVRLDELLRVLTSHPAVAFNSMAALGVSRGVRGAV